MAVKDRGVDIDGEALGLGSLDGRYGAVEYARLTNGLVVMLAQSVEMNGEEQIGRGLEQMQLLLQKQCIRAERDELRIGDRAIDDLADLAMDQRLAPGNGYHRRAAFVGGVEALLDRQPSVEDRIGIVDLAAADASEVAAKQRLQHEHKRVAFTPRQLLLEDVGANAHFLEKRDLHSFCLPVCRFRTVGQRLSPSPVRGVIGTQYALGGRGESRLRPRPACATC